MMMPAALFKLRSAHVLVSCFLILGCSSDTPESLHEVDHFVAEHWPTSLADASTKIETRVMSLQEKHSDGTYEELCDIVGWIPEIAADTDISEADWLPIYEASRALSNRLRSGSSQSITNLAVDLRALQDLVVREADKLAKIDRQKEEQAKSEVNP